MLSLGRGTRVSADSRAATPGRRAATRLALVSAVLAPAALVAGLVVAPLVQPAGYSSIHDSISQLAAYGARDRWVMTAGLAMLGLSDILTAIGLVGARLPGRVALVVGGTAGLGVAAFAQHRFGTHSAPGHQIAATIGLAVLALWPALASPGQGMLRRRPALVATAVLSALVLWFAVVLQLGHGGYYGLAERVVVLTEALWPLAVVIDQRGRLLPSLGSDSGAPSGGVHVRGPGSAP